MQRIEKNVSIDAPRSVVWEALTNPSFIPQWMGTQEMRIEVSSDWQVAAPIIITGFHHAAFQNKGTILRFEPEQVLCYTHLSSLSRLPDESQNYSTPCFALASTENETSVTLTIDNFPTEAIFKHLSLYWATTLQLLKKFVEQRHAVGDALGRQSNG
jgi:uncharacterized protein YndB with AHSA1/START domain